MQTEEEVGGDTDLKDDVTDTGAGLYKDEYEDNRYVYKGKKPIIM